MSEKCETCEKLKAERDELKYRLQTWNDVQAEFIADFELDKAMNALRKICKQYTTTRAEKTEIYAHIVAPYDAKRGKVKE